VLTIPQFPLLAVLAAYLRLSSPILLAFLIAALAWPTLLRAVRGQVLSLKERDYVEAARALDLGTSRILFREILPNMRAYLAMYFVLAMTNAIYAQVGLYLLGFAPLSGDNWGIMLNLAWYRGAIFFKDSFWYIMTPILAISLVQRRFLDVRLSPQPAIDRSVVARRNQPEADQCGIRCVHEVGVAGPAGGNHRFSQQHGLGQNQTEALATMQRQHDVGAPGESVAVFR